MQRRISRTFLVFTAVTLLLAGFFLTSTRDLRSLGFKPPSAFDRFSPKPATPATPSLDAGPDLLPPKQPDAAPPAIQDNLQEPSKPVAPPQSPDSPIPPFRFSAPATAELDGTSKKPDASVLLPEFPSSSPEVATPAPGFLSPAPNDTSFTVNKGPLVVDVIESNGWHDEVVAALVHPLGSQKNVQLNIYQKKARYGILEIMQNFTLPSNISTPRSPEIFNNAPENGSYPDIVVATTCETDVKHLLPRFEKLVKRGKTFLYCVVHHADQWGDEELKKIISPWIEKGLMDFVTLSPHTAKFLETQGLDNWPVKISRPIKSFSPVFPVDLSPVTAKSEVAGKGELAFALQGNYEPARRDFEGIFANLESFILQSSTRDDEDRGSNVTLHLLGSGPRPKVPPTVQDHVFFDEDLSYGDFYNILSQNFALLPAFANNEYLDRKASSSVPASLIAGTPLVATKEILAAYAYLPKNAVYLRKAGETELDVIGRVLKDRSKERMKKTKAVRTACAKLVDSNVDLFTLWLKEAKARIGR